MNYLIIFLTVLFCVNQSVAGTYSYEIQQAMKECRIERTSFKPNGTPSCQKVKDLIKLQRLETEAETSEHTGQEMPSHVYIGDDEY